MVARGPTRFASSSWSSCPARRRRWPGPPPHQRPGPMAGRAGARRLCARDRGAENPRRITRRQDRSQRPGRCRRVRSSGWAAAPRSSDIDTAGADSTVRRSRSFHAVGDARHRRRPQLCAFVRRGSLDSRAGSGYSRSGTLLQATLHDYRQRNDGPYSFRRVDAIARQLIPILHGNWVIDLSVRTSTTAPTRATRCRSSCMPDLGGGGDLRGYSQLSVPRSPLDPVTGEYRWYVAGVRRHGGVLRRRQGASRRGDLDFDDLKSDVGIGIRFHAPQTTGCASRSPGARRPAVHLRVQRGGQVTPMKRIPILLTVPCRASRSADNRSGADRPRFYSDDPIPVSDTQDASKVAGARDLARLRRPHQPVRAPGHQEVGRAASVNTIDEVPDSSGSPTAPAPPLTPPDVLRGPNDDTGPAPGKWAVSRKANGVSPGFTITDARASRYFVKFDPPGDPELGTGARSIVTRLFHALGYHVPQTNIGTLRREDLVVGADATVRMPGGGGADARVGHRRAARPRASQSRRHLPRRPGVALPGNAARGVHVPGHPPRRSERRDAARGSARAARAARVQRLGESHGREGHQLARHARQRKRPQLRPAPPDRLQRRARQRRHRAARAPRRLRVPRGNRPGRRRRCSPSASTCGRG